MLGDMGKATNGRPAAGRDALADRRPDVASRLSLNVPVGWWPVAPLAKSFEAAGFRWLQVHTPPREMLCEPGRAARHAARLRAALDVSGWRSSCMRPTTSAPAHRSTTALWMLIDYAAAARARYVVYHGVNFGLLARAIRPPRPR